MSSLKDLTLNSNKLFNFIIQRQQLRGYATHWNPKFKKLRANKVIKVI
jgi:hypothetical protein